VASFWTGFSAARAHRIRAAGGFAPLDSLEDVDLGSRLAQHGADIHLRADLQATHLKQWSWLSMLYTDTWLRGAAWTELMYRYPALRQTMITARSYRWAPALLATTLACARRPGLAGLLLLAYLLINMPIYRFMRRCGGGRFGVRSIGYLMAYHACCVAGLLLGLVRIVARRQALPPDRRIL
jgi:hypothetical protein